jgi:hypothetical protein
MADNYAVRHAPTLDATYAAADRLVSTNQRGYLSAVGCFTGDLEALRAIRRIPVRHRISGTHYEPGRAVVRRTMGRFSHAGEHQRPRRTIDA